MLCEVKKMKKVILFDFFGVISSEVAPKWFARFFDDAEAKRIKDELVSPGDLGNKNEEEILEDVAAVCSADKEYVRAEWYKLAEVDKKIVEYIKKLRKSHPVYLLSNAVDTFLQRIICKNRLEDLFDKIYISSEIKLAKPDKNFFIYCLNDIGASPSDCVMIDDNPRNIASAESVGISGIVYENLDILKEKLNNMI